MAEAAVGRPEIRLDGMPLPPELGRVLVRTVVDTGPGVPAAVSLHFRDSGRTLLRPGRVRFGSRLEVRSPDARDGASPLVAAEVTAMEQDSDGGGTSVILRGYDLSHRLTRGRRSRAFKDVTDGDIVRRVARDAALEVGHIDDDGVVHDHVGQANVSDWEFLRTRAHNRGRLLDCADGRLSWIRAREAADAPAGPAAADLFAPGSAEHLMLGRELLRFRPRVSAAQQVGEVRVRGWDPTTKQVVEGSAQPQSASAAVAFGPAALGRTFGAAAHVVVDRSVRDQDEADGIAATVAAQLAAVQAEAHGTAVGNPRLVPGIAVRIDGVGWPHDGWYVVSSARHIWDDTGYVTDFAVTGDHERSLLALTGNAGASGRNGERVHGLVVGQVTDVDDPDRLFRVKLRFPWLADDYESAWCRVATPGAGGGRGLVALPEVGDEVLVGFAHGDIGEPFVLGNLFNGIDTPPLADQLVDPVVGRVRTRALVSRSDHRIVLQDDDADPLIRISSGGGGVTVTLDGGRTALVLDSAGTVTVHGATGVRISSDADLGLSAAGSLSLQAADGISIDGGPQVTVSAGSIRLG